MAISSLSRQKKSLIQGLSHQPSKPDRQDQDPGDDFAPSPFLSLLETNSLLCRLKGSFFFCRTQRKGELLHTPPSLFLPPRFSHSTGDEMGDGYQQREGFDNKTTKKSSFVKFDFELELYSGLQPEL